MKNLLFISALMLLQCACSTPQTVPSGGSALLGFTDLASEISVTHEIIETTASVSDDSKTDATD